MNQEYLKSRLSYDPETGVFIWLRPYKTFMRYLGKRAGHIEACGYRVVCIDRKIYKMHRLAFLYMTGSFPKLFIDHINRNKDDNRWINLREVTKSENGHNSNKVGVHECAWKKDKLLKLPTGVSKRSDCVGYLARIYINKKVKELGTYKTIEEARMVYVNYKNKLLPESNKITTKEGSET